MKKEYSWNRPWPFSKKVKEQQEEARPDARPGVIITSPVVFKSWADEMNIRTQLKSYEWAYNGTSVVIDDQFAPVETDMQKAIREATEMLRG